MHLLGSLNAVCHKEVTVTPNHKLSGICDALFLIPNDVNGNINDLLQKSTRKDENDMDIDTFWKCNRT